MCSLNEIFTDATDLWKKPLHVAEKLVANLFRHVSLVCMYFFTFLINRSTSKYVVSDIEMPNSTCQAFIEVSSRYEKI